MNIILAIGFLIILFAGLFEVFVIPLRQKKKIKEFIEPLKLKYKGTIWEPYTEFAEIYLNYARKVENMGSYHYSPFNDAMEEIEKVLAFADSCNNPQLLDKVEVPLDVLENNLEEYNTKGLFKDNAKALENLIGANTVLRWRIEDLHKNSPKINSKKPNYNV